MLNLLLSSVVFLLKSTGALSLASAACCLWLSFLHNACSLLVGAELACPIALCHSCSIYFYYWLTCPDVCSYFPVLFHLFIEILSLCEGQQTYFPSL